MRTGGTDSEQFVYEICKRSFLSLWSFVNPRIQYGSKELCDILIVFNPHVIVVSVKDVKLKDTGNEKIDWERWHRKAIKDSHKQIKGAIRSLNRSDVVVEQNGNRSLPLPPLEQRIYHRIAVAFGGRREVLITNSSMGDDFVHIFDETSFALLLQFLNTIPDFVSYLVDKEKFLLHTAVIITGGEEELLANYIHKGREFPKETDFFLVDNGAWNEIIAKPEFIAKLKEDEISYAWDELIETISRGGFNEPTWHGPELSESEKALRVLAKENRFSRRLLSKTYLEFLTKAKAKQAQARCFQSPSGVGYVFYTYAIDSTIESRRNVLVGRCHASILHFPGCTTIIGIGTNVPGQRPHDGFSTVLVLLMAEGDIWSKEMFDAAEFFRDKMGYFKNPIETHRSEYEYPNENENTL